MRAPMYKSNKRKKELTRQKKQEEKRLKRLNSIKGNSPDSATTDGTIVEPEASENTSEVAENTED